MLLSAVIPSTSAYRIAFIFSLSSAASSSSSFFCVCASVYIKFLWKTIKYASSCDGISRPSHPIGGAFFITIASHLKAFIAFSCDSFNRVRSGSFMFVQHTITMSSLYSTCYVRSSDAFDHTNTFLKLQIFETEGIRWAEPNNNNEKTTHRIPP